MNPHTNELSTAGFSKKYFVNNVLLLVHDYLTVVITFQQLHKNPGLIEINVKQTLVTLMDVKCEI